MKTYDAIIAGGGPAGSSAASYLQMKGRSALVLEREQFPRFHLGESMLPFATDYLAELGVLPEVERHYIRKPGARIIDEGSGETFTYYFDNAIDASRPYAWQVPRADFDQLLLDNSRRLGAEVRERTEVKQVRFLPDHVEVDAAGPDGARYTVEAPVFVDATGRDTFLGREKGLKVADEEITTNVGCFTHYEGCLRQSGDDEGNFTLIMFDGGWWWFIPFKGDVTSVGVVFQKEYTLAHKGLSPQQLFDGAIAEQKTIKQILAGARRVRPVDTTGNWSYRSKAYFGDRWLLVGDAAAFIDPLFSTGVLLALASAKFAAEAIDEAHQANDFSVARFQGYEEKALAGADLFKRLVHEYYGANLRQLLVASGQTPAMCGMITSLLAGDVYKKRMWHGVMREGFSKVAIERFPGIRPASNRNLTRG